jgi:excisionase family DNA binding protein
MHDRRKPMNASPEDLLTVGEVAKLLRVHDSTVRRWIKAGVLEAILLPRRGSHQIYRIRRSTLDALLASRPKRQDVVE